MGYCHLMQVLMVRGCFCDATNYFIVLKFDIIKATEAQTQAW
jgi:hypothetical protein